MQGVNLQLDTPNEPLTQRSDTNHLVNLLGLQATSPEPTYYELNSQNHLFSGGHSHRAGGQGPQGSAHTPLSYANGSAYSQSMAGKNPLPDYLIRNLNSRLSEQ